MPKLYGKKFANRFYERKQHRRFETRDAVLWSVNVADRVAQIKFQGSGELVYATFPRNWNSIPYWLKIGNAVRVVHRGGVRGYIEVAGEGRAIPAPVEGGYLPDAPALVDAIISGLEVSPTDPYSMNVEITAGTYRINSTNYELLVGSDMIMGNDPVLMGTSPLITMNYGTSVLVTIDPAPAAGLYRYDLIQIGTDGLVDYIAGTPHATAPVKPTLSANHIALAYILVYGGITTVIEESNIGSLLATPTTSYILITGDTSMAWDGGDDHPEITMTVNVYDQYGQTPAGSFTCTCTKGVGSGEVWCADSGYDTNEVTEDHSSPLTFKYRRDQTASPEVSPVMLTFELEKDNLTTISAMHYVVLYDVGGDPI